MVRSSSSKGRRWKGSACFSEPENRRTSPHFRGTPHLRKNRPFSKNNIPHLRIISNIRLAIPKKTNNLPSSAIASASLRNSLLQKNPEYVLYAKELQKHKKGVDSLISSWKRRAGFLLRKNRLPTGRQPNVLFPYRLT